ncbi:hypothetical protein QCA50_011567 [Cerrena zonata]|uniref:Zn(2)-C6 fungal-type domain-containing protein n=1 Tax=Cerrena zonata TaxID=2478898 RepID=A0AAW0G1H3_9APHY
MADIRFVLESPQSVQAQKKRPRLVTSCDNCRLKKVKCIQNTPDVKCEACSNAQIPCRFRDRERYFAERSRIMAGTSPDSGRRSAQSSRASSSSTGWNSSGTPSPDRDITPPIVPSNATARSAATLQPIRDEYSMGRCYPQMSWSEFPQSTSMNNSYTPHVFTGVNSINGSQWDYGSTSHYSPEIPSPSSASSQYPGQSSSEPTVTPLFDLRHPDRPHANLMAYFIQAFFDNLSSSFPFMSYEVTVEQFLTQSLSPVLSSSIAALAARYVHCPEVTSLGATNVQAAYCANAERLLASLSTFPTLDTLHATILLAWAEYKRNRTSMFCFHAQMSNQMAWTLGLADDSAMSLTQTELQQTMLRSTWACVNQLHATAADQMSSIVPPLH